MADEPTGTVTAGAALAAIERERVAWEDLLAAVGEARMLEPGAMGGWTFKDLVAHLSGWRDRSLARLEAAAHGQPDPAPPWPPHLDADDDADVEAINAWIYGQNADRLLAEVVEGSRRGYARLAAVVQALPEADLNDPARFPWMEGAALGPAIASGALFGHLHEEHEPGIRAWLATPAPPRAPSGVEL